MRRDKFDPDDIRKEDMNHLADNIEEYITQLEEVMIIPDEMLDECEDQIKEGIKRSKKLVQKLRRGDRSVFKDSDDWNNIP